MQLCHHDHDHDDGEHSVLHAEQIAYTYRNRTESERFWPVVFRWAVREEPTPTQVDFALL